MNIEEIRSKYPQYNDLSDDQLATGLHKKFYSDIPFDEFSSKIGYSASKPMETLSGAPVGEETTSDRLGKIGLKLFGLKNAPDRAIASGIHGSAASIYAGAEAIVKYGQLIGKQLAEVTGLPEGGAIAEPLTKFLEGQRKSAMERAVKSMPEDAGVTEKVIAGLASAPGGIAEFGMNVPYAMIKGYMNNGLKGMVEEGASRAIWGWGLGYAHGVPPARAAAIMGVAAGAESLARGEGIQDTAANTVIMMILGWAAGNKQLSRANRIRVVRAEEAAMKRDFKDLADTLGEVNKSQPDIIIEATIRAKNRVDELGKITPDEIQKEVQRGLGIKEEDVADSYLALKKMGEEGKKPAEGRKEVEKEVSPIEKIEEAPVGEETIVALEEEIKPLATGLGDLGGAAKAITGNLYEGLFKSLQEGKKTFAGVKDPWLEKASPYFERGEIKSPQDLQDFVNNRGKFEAKVSEAITQESITKEAISTKIKELEDTGRVDEAEVLREAFSITKEEVKPIEEAPLGKEGLRKEEEVGKPLVEAPNALDLESTKNRDNLINIVDRLQEEYKETTDPVWKESLKARILDGKSILDGLQSDYEGYKNRLAEYAKEGKENIGEGFPISPTQIASMAKIDVPTVQRMDISKPETIVNPIVDLFNKRNEAEKAGAAEQVKSIQKQVKKVKSIFWAKAAKDERAGRVTREQTTKAWDEIVKAEDASMTPQQKVKKDVVDVLEGNERKDIYRIMTSEEYKTEVLDKIKEPTAAELKMEEEAIEKEIKLNEARLVRAPIIRRAKEQGRSVEIKPLKEEIERAPTEEQSKADSDELTKLLRESGEIDGVIEERPGQYRRKGPKELRPEEDFTWNVDEDRYRVSRDILKKGIGEAGAIGGGKQVADWTKALRDTAVYHIERGMAKAKDFVQRMVEEHGEKIRPYATKAWDEAKGSIKPAELFYSGMQKTIERKMPASATPEHVRGILKEVSPEEVKWSGVEEFLKDKTRVSKAEIQDFLKENQVRVETVEKGEGNKLDETLKKAYEYHDTRAEAERIANTLRPYFDEVEVIHHDWNNKWEARLVGTKKEFQESRTKFSQHQLPGGENYREVLLKLPQATQDFKSTHWEEPNVLAHVRLNDRVDADGRKVLFVEEVQSDWGLQARKKGVLTKEAEVRQIQLLDEMDALRKQGKTETPEYETLRQEAIRIGGDLGQEKVSDAPFLKAPHELAMKRVLRMAAEEGYDKVSWISGEETAKRYDLSRHINEIRYSKLTEGQYGLEFFDKNDTRLSMSNTYPEAKLEELVGKDIAAKIINGEGSDKAFGRKSLSGVDLKVGGEWATKLYDKMIPQFLEKYGKKWGVEIDKSGLTLAGKDSQAYLNDAIVAEIGDRVFGVTDRLGRMLFYDKFPTKEDARIFLETKKQGRPATFQSISVTPQMRADLIYKGQPLFTSPAKAEPSFLSKESYNESRKFLKDYTRDKLFGGGPDLAYLTHLTKIAGYKISMGAKKFELYAQDMVREFGEKVRPYLLKSWQAAQTQHKLQTEVYNSKYRIADPNTAVKFRNDAPIADQADLATVRSTVNDLPNRWFYLGNWLTTPERAFDYMDAANPAAKWKDTLLRPYRHAEKEKLDGLKLVDAQVETAKKSGIPDLSKRLAMASYAEQPGGKRIMEEFMGIKEISTLTANERQILDNFKSQYEWAWGEINKMRVAIGVEPIGYIENYSPFAMSRAIELLEKNGMDPVTATKTALENAFQEASFDFTHPRMTKFQYENRKMAMQNLSLDFFGTYKRYMNTALRHIYISPIAAKANALISEWTPSPADKALTKMGMKENALIDAPFKLADNARNFTEYLQEWSDHITGKPPVEKWPKAMQDLMFRLRNNVVAYTLMFSNRTTLVQFAAMAQAWPQVGSRSMIKGVHKVASTFREGRNERYAKSDVLSVRRGHYETALDDFIDAVRNNPNLAEQYAPFEWMRKAGTKYRVGTLGKVHGTVKGAYIKAGAALMTMTDAITADIVWEGAYAKARNKSILNLNEASAIRYADDMVIKTQGSAAKGEITPLQRRQWGKTISVFQTYNINQWGNIVEDIMGMSRPGMDKRTAISNTLWYMISMAVANVIYEDLLGMQSPFPSIFRMIAASLKAGDSAPIAALKGAREVTELVPFAASTTKFGSHPLGAVADLLGATGTVIGGRKGPKPSGLEVAGKWVGFPGGGQIAKSVRQYKNNPEADLYDILMGNYTGVRETMLEEILFSGEGGSPKPLKGVEGLKGIKGR